MSVLSHTYISLSGFAVRHLVISIYVSFLYVRTVIVMRSRLVLQLIKNAFTHGLYTYTAMMNHDCWPNCITKTVPYDGDIYALEVKLSV